MKDFLLRQTAIGLVKETITKGEECPLFPIGSCMAPLICHKDRVIAKYTAADDVHLGDIVVYQVSSDRLFLHRVIYKRVNGGHVTLLTKADNLLLAEPPITADRILAKVTAVEKGSRTIRLDSKSSCFFNRWLARYSYCIHLLASHLRSLKRALARNKKYPVLNLIQKALQKVSSSLAKFLVNLIFLVQKEIRQEGSNNRKKRRYRVRS